jgi:hypothetical protein
VHSTQCAASSAAAPTTRVRRLTKVEIQNATTALLGQDATAALSNLDADSQINGGFSNSAALVVSDSFASGLNTAADTIGTQFKATVTSANYDKTCFSTDTAAETCAKTFIRTFGARAFRRPITDGDVTGLFTVYQTGREVGTDGDAGDRFATGLSYVVRAMVQSPDFLYLTELGDAAAANGAKTKLLPDEVANAISFSVLGAPPDDVLTAAAAGNQLATADQREAQVMRLIAANPDGWKRQMRQFVLEWLGINFSKPEWSKDTAAVPLYSASMRDALSTETGMLIDDWATASDGALVSSLLTAPVGFVNQVNAPLYGVTASGMTFQKVSLDPGQRAGILTLGGFLGSTSHVGETSPVMRGKAILQNFLCQDPPPPPPVVPPLPPADKSAPTTTRARFAAHLADKACSGCHSFFEPMGDAFEEFDALGAYRTDQNGYPIDSTGALVGTSKGTQPVANAVELAQLLAQDPDALDCVTRQVFRFTMGRLEGDYDSCNVAQARQVLTGGTSDLRQVISSIVRSDSFVVRTAAFTK